MKIDKIAFCLLLFFLVCPPVMSAERPNILLIVADDVGYSDLECYGGEIDTPNLDQLASSGIRFSEFHVNPMCVVTRTSLMTGHTHSQSDHYRRSLPIATLMQQAGYATSISGKWHQPGNPLDAGFDSFCGFLNGAIDSWNGTEAGKDAIQSNRMQPQPVPPNWYSSDAFTDDAIRQIDAAQRVGKPFFTYVAYNAPHSPLQAPRENVEKYYKRYLPGWQSLRRQRYERMLAMGVIDESYVMSEPHAEVRRWDELPAAIQTQESRRMAAYAGMLDRMDWNVGRLLNHLRQQQLDDNTLILFMADNGGAYSNGDIRTYDDQTPWKAGTNPYASNGWAYLKNTPFRWYKSSAHEGGVSVPMIIRWPKTMALPSPKKSLASEHDGLDRTADENLAGRILKQRLHVTDLYPTFLELAGVSYPATDGDRKLEPLYGKSLLPLLCDPSLADDAIHDEIFWCFNQTGKGLVKGDWKISSISDGPWRLYNIRRDPAEAKDLAAEMPEVLAKMSESWFRFAKDHTTMPPSWRAPLKDYQEGWGFHRLRMVMPSFVRAVPASSAMNVPCDTDLSFYFSEPIRFANSAGKTLRLYEASDINKVVWQADPAAGHPAEGTQKITFDDLPRLKPHTTYFVLSDTGWITLGDIPAIGLNDGAYWYRFRTGSD
ncbi:arylsulfatase [Rhodopirellula maiorica SM1]|uniref:Arylsulfatase n=1 Tax=Rhodopirellula maiorica SM1 TaxID=1265738 RepID=M5RKQ8_9BACT|nr:sulfatase-like hydrolase/transferase [Rhodopirellula maiorica]EMI15952.1 arylsulfatase [Rhodopirellula maiorica SM1]